MDEALRQAAFRPKEQSAPIKWYSRSALERFLVDAEAERARLENTIADANARLARAGASIGLHQTMMEMLLEAQRVVRDVRREAEARAAEIIAAGEREAEAILRSAPNVRREDPIVGTVNPWTEVSTGPTQGPRSENGDGASAPPAGTSGAPEDEFFQYLRGALDDDQPLGPAT